MWRYSLDGARAPLPRPSAPDGREVVNRAETAPSKLILANQGKSYHYVIRLDSTMIDTLCINLYGYPISISESWRGLHGTSALPKRYSLVSSGCSAVTGRQGQAAETAAATGEIIRRMKTSMATMSGEASAQRAGELSPIAGMTLAARSARPTLSFPPLCSESAFGSGNTRCLSKADCQTKG